MTVAAKLDGNGFVVGLWKGGSATPPAGLVEVSDADHQSMIAGGLTYRGNGPHRWKIVGGVLQEQADSRPIARFRDTNTGNPDRQLLELDVGGASGSILVEVVDEQGDVRTNINITKRPRIGGYRVKLVITNGVATINVPTDRPRSVRIDSCEDYQVVAPMVIEVCDTGF